MLWKQIPGTKVPALRLASNIGNRRHSAPRGQVKEESKYHSMAGGAEICDTCTEYSNFTADMLYPALCYVIFSCASTNLSHPRLNQRLAEAYHYGTTTSMDRSGEHGKGTELTTPRFP